LSEHNLLPSPVPADRFLLPGEFPFTSFGQLGAGNLDKRVFEQDQWWVDVNGVPHVLTEMTTEYLRNVLNFLFRDIESFYLGALLRYAVHVSMTSLDIPEIDPAEFSDFVYSLSNISEQNPAEWLNSTPLVQKIMSILDSRE